MKPPVTLTTKQKWIFDRLIKRGYKIYNYKERASEAESSIVWLYLEPPDYYGQGDNLWANSCHLIISIGDKYAITNRLSFKPINSPFIEIQASLELSKNSEWENLEKFEKFYRANYRYLKDFQ